MDDQQPDHPEQQTADIRAGDAGILRELLDVNTYFLAGRPGWPRWFAIRLILFALGNEIGWIVWQTIDEDSAGDRWFGERMISNAYIWACLIATALYAVHDRRARRSTCQDRLNLWCPGSHIRRQQVAVGVAAKYVWYGTCGYVVPTGSRAQILLVSPPLASRRGRRALPPIGQADPEYSAGRRRYGRWRTPSGRVDTAQE